jgi:hypothetical protein
MDSWMNKAIVQHSLQPATGGGRQKMVQEGPSLQGKGLLRGPVGYWVARSGESAPQSSTRSPQRVQGATVRQMLPPPTGPVMPRGNGSNQRDNKNKNIRKPGSFLEKQHNATRPKSGRAMKTCAGFPHDQMHLGSLVGDAAG